MYKVVKTTAIEANGNVLKLTIPDMVLHHGQHIRVCFAQIPPVITDGPLKVKVEVNGDVVKILHNRAQGAFGTFTKLYSDQLQQAYGRVKARQYIDLIYSSDTNSFAYCGPCRVLMRSNMNFPIFTVNETAK